MREAVGTWRTWGFEAAAGTVVLLGGLYDVVRGLAGPSDAAATLLVLALAVATALSRRLPSVSLALVWVAFWAQLLGGVGLLSVEVSVALVAFGCARWGSAATVVLSALSIPLAGAIAAYLVLGSPAPELMFDSGIRRVLVELRHGTGFGPPLLLVAMLSPWLAGLALRFAARARSSQVSQERAETQASEAVRERVQAEEIARLRETQAQLARDVHDVVGHSLAVILAQAESAQYVDDAQPERLKQTLATIATSARDSLRDVRQVLTDTQATRSASDADLDALVDGVRAGGRDVQSTEVGPVRPLPPELATVAYRVLQEMLTNAIRHGSRSEPIRVERHWEGELRIEVGNAVDAVTHGAPEETGPLTRTGQGLDGMRRRLEAVGGRLDVRRRDEGSGGSFTCTAWLPLRAEERAR